MGAVPRGWWNPWCIDLKLEVNVTEALSNIMYSASFNMIAACFGTAILFACALFILPSGKDESNEPIEQEAISAVEVYPVDMLLTNAEGMELYVILRGRSDTEIIITRKRDGLDFRYPLKDLSEESRKLVMDYPNNQVPELED